MRRESVLCNSEILRLGPLRSSGALAALRHLDGEALRERLRAPVSYAVGWLSSYWLIVRIAGF